MKKIILFTFVIALITSCSSKKDDNQKNKKTEIIVIVDNPSDYLDNGNNEYKFSITDWIKSNSC